MRYGITGRGLLASPGEGILLVGAHPGLSTYNPDLNVALALLMVPYAIFTTRQRGFSMDGMFGDLSYIVYLLHWVGVCWISSPSKIEVIQCSSRGGLCTGHRNFNCDMEGKRPSNQRHALRLGKE